MRGMPDRLRLKPDMLRQFRDEIPAMSRWAGRTSIQPRMTDLSPGEGYKDGVKSVELTLCTGKKESFGTRRQPGNIVPHRTEAGEGRAFIVVSVPGKEDAAMAARASYTMIAEALR